LNTRTTNLETITTTEDNDIEKLFNDLYTTPDRDGTTNPDLLHPIETQVNVGRLEQFEINTFTDGDTTPSVESSNVYNHPGKLWVLNGSSTYTITNFDDGVAGQEIDILFDINYPTVKVTIESNANIRLAGGTDFEGSRYDVLTLIYNGSIWVEKTRSLNS